MRSATRSPSPVRVGDVLLAAVPALEERLLAERIRLGWRAAVGADLSRRSRPGELKGGTLTIMVDNSPWLQELSMRSAEVLSAIRARFGPSVTSVRLSLAGPAPAAPGPARRATPPTGSTRLDPDEAALVESALAPVQDADLASTLRRVVSKDLIARRSRSLAILALGGAILAGALAGCASTGTIADSDASSSTVEATPLVRRPIGAQGEAYDHYVIAQMEARAGRLPQAIAQLREAIKTDPDSAVLWIQLSQWQVRMNDVTGAFTAA
ncbi:MAG TPA: DciA family protein, partial [Methylomirabilota bacterium]|nr:DciA family protein [Methylomirabilota bacterium]